MSMKFFSLLLLCTTASLATDVRVAHALPPLPSQAQDPADSLYSRARRALDDKDYDGAARLFDAIVTRFPRSAYAPDALYWKGFALYRGGNLDAAQSALEAQAARYPNAPTRRDAAPLLILVKGELAKRGDAAARRDVDSAASVTTGTCRDMETRVAALDALQQMDAERVLPLLRKVMMRRDACAAPLRKNALFVLAQKGGAERDRLLLEIAKSDPSTSVRNDAVFYLGQTKSDAAVDALEDVLLHGDQNAVRGNALYALAQIGTDRATRIVRQFALTEGGPKSLRNDALYHAAQASSAETNKWLATVIVNAQAPMELRKNAAYHLAQRSGDATQELTAVYDSSLPTDLKKDLVYYIAQRKDDRALMKLIAIAKSDPNVSLRKDALYHLAQSKDPRALKALEDMVSP
jgi:tetratricopeptide (TPR) repeat protein